MCLMTATAFAVISAMQDISWVPGGGLYVALAAFFGFVVTGTRKKNTGDPWHDQEHGMSLILTAMKILMTAEEMTTRQALFLPTALTSVHGQ